VDCYVDGDWSAGAKNHLDVCSQMNAADGPTNWMNEYLLQKNFVVDANWKGFRDIDFKQQRMDYGNAPV